MPRPPARAFDEYFRAYSVAMLNQKERANVSYGGKIIMPPSALASLTRLDIEAPWMFQLRNPSNSAATTHSGVLEFIADEGCVYLPYWMMKTLRLAEGDAIRITGAVLPKGTLVKLQAQTVDFLDVSEPKAVLEQSFRNYSALTMGDIIEIAYNGLTFELLVMEVQPLGQAINIIDVDLSVEFAPPKGYVEPERPAPKPVPTMASKLGIDTGKQETVAEAAGFEAFKGVGQALNGRRTKGKGKSGRKIQEVDEFSRIIRTDKPKLMTSDTVDAERKVPAALNLPFGKLFFGFPVTPLRPVAESTQTAPAAAEQEQTFQGQGQTLSGRRPRGDRPPLAPAGTAAAGAGGAGQGEKKPEEGEKWKGKGRSLTGKREVIELD
ncbi:UFD1-domain-containing protein [Dacryopinax primogenitus]|uniref:UFD1-domain-containing protein n=1 Tax=Dacryopinax primogenitus (strain DJM 731) TaxID=1858805 RepID=M5G957_DACPD|nr:UFD1-domain-containing protein [Dacryopinax primogenitus]EJU05284.1 UFD1-domain-containing protein [Dacryopinax primogenitus]